MRMLGAVLIGLVATGCARRVSTTSSPRVLGSPTVVAVNDDDGGGAKAKQNAKGKAPARGPRKLGGVPPGHFPPKGQCRLWFPGRPPGKQPPSTSCSSLRGRVPAGAFILYNGDGWDADYDWATRARHEPGSVPGIIVDILSARAR